MIAYNMPQSLADWPDLERAMTTYQVFVRDRLRLMIAEQSGANPPEISSDEFMQAYIRMMKAAMQDAPSPGSDEIVGLWEELSAVLRVKWGFGRGEPA